MALVTTTLTSTGSVTLQKLVRERYVRITLTGTYSGATVDLAGSLTATPNYAPVGALDETAFADVTSALITTSAANKTYQLNGAGLQYVRVNVSALASGSITVSIYSDDHGQLMQVAGA